MSFSLSGLQPHQEPFDLGNGKTIYFRSVKELDLQEYAAWQRVNIEIQKIGDKRKKAKTEQRHATVEKQNLSLCRELIVLILPDLPTKILDGLSVAQTDSLAATCITVASGRFANQLADEDDVQKLKQHYPELPDEFLQSLTRFQVAKFLPEPETAVPEGN